MSYSQDYSIPGIVDLYKKLTGETLSIEELVKEKLQEKGFAIAEEKNIMLVDGDICCEDVYGKEIKVRSFDNRGFKLDEKTYVPKLVKRYTSNGNYGLDTYEWKEIDDNNFGVQQESHGEINSEKD